MSTRWLVEVVPCAASLSIDELHEFLVEFVAAAEPWGPRPNSEPGWQVFHARRHTVEALANPPLAVVLSGASTKDYGPVPCPLGPRKQSGLATVAGGRKLSVVCCRNNSMNTPIRLTAVTAVALIPALFSASPVSAADPDPILIDCGKYGGGVASDERAPAPLTPRSPASTVEHASPPLKCQ